MNDSFLAGLPTDGHHLEEIVLEDQIARVVVVPKEGIRFQRLGTQPHRVDVLTHQLLGDQITFKAFEALNKVIDRRAEGVTHIASIDPCMYGIKPSFRESWMDSA